MDRRSERERRVCRSVPARASPSDCWGRPATPTAPSAPLPIAVPFDDYIQLIMVSMALVRVASVSELQPGWVIEARVAGQTYAICNSGGEIHALDGSCPCTGGSSWGWGVIRE